MIKRKYGNYGSVFFSKDLEGNVCFFSPPNETFELTGYRTGTCFDSPLGKAYLLGSTRKTWLRPDFEKWLFKISEQENVIYVDADEAKTWSVAEEYDPKVTYFSAENLKKEQTLKYVPLDKTWTLSPPSREVQIRELLASTFKYTGLHLGEPFVFDEMLLHVGGIRGKTIFLYGRYSIRLFDPVIEEGGHVLIPYVHDEETEFANHNTFKRRMSDYPPAFLPCERDSGSDVPNDENVQFTDITVTVGEKVFFLHKFMLVRHMQYFRNYFHFQPDVEEMVMSAETKPDAFRAVVRYAYGMPFDYISSPCSVATGREISVGSKQKTQHCGMRSMFDRSFGETSNMVFFDPDILLCANYLGFDRLEKIILERIPGLLTDINVLPLIQTLNTVYPDEKRIVDTCVDYARRNRERISSKMDVEKIIEEGGVHFAILLSGFRRTSPFSADEPPSKKQKT